MPDTVIRVPVSHHVENLRRIGCILSATDQDVELHHCHGGSMRGIVQPTLARKANPFFQIPLAKRYHTGEFNPEAMGMETWEARFGRQIDLLRELNLFLPYNLFFQAGLIDGNEIQYQKLATGD